ncbi:hypothetical protein [Mucilaginibacter celer]|nr:hypothetical protein [Mucilaginibacter celer]
MSEGRGKRSVTITNNPIIKMIEDQKRIVKAIKNGENISTLRGIKIASPV